jgi:hypothetical protein
VRITRGDLALSLKEGPCKPACWRSSGSEKSAEGIRGPSSIGPKARTSRQGEELSFRW